ncbi:hypothetical protein TWF481_002901 [Arthrobotrys musiformis]|uniref:Carbohydrate kinase PfkB domain-containing protein n=1 Tax=Arthrobotrys musiformis TaxID=47236 RepID=A0AAV9VRM3_9PEZI
MAAESIAVVGGLNMDMIYCVDRVPNLGESKDAISFAQRPGGKGANTAVAAYRASHVKLWRKLLGYPSRQLGT